jgi:hypothetical protein
MELDGIDKVGSIVKSGHVLLTNLAKIRRRPVERVSETVESRRTVAVCGESRSSAPRNIYHACKPKFKGESGPRYPRPG